MATARDLHEIILELVEQKLDCDVDELVVHCPEATWNQIFLVLDNLSRKGRVSLRLQEPGRYKVALAPQRPPNGQDSNQYRT